MTLILSGTDGLSDVDGSAATPAIRGTDANTGIFFPAADTIGFSEGGVERARIDSSGNLGLGVIPSPWNTFTASFQIDGASLSGLGANNTALASNAYYQGAWKYYGTGSASLYQQNAGQHAWSVAGSGTAGNAITFTQALTLNANGALALQGAASANGIGITFPATQSASSDANTLDDYEEGTFTPSFSSSGSVTYATRTASYIKIGRLVQSTIALELSAISSPTGALTITGLPFTNGSGEQFVSGITVGLARNFASVLTITGYIGSASTTLQLSKNASNANFTALQGSDLTSSTLFYVSLTYMTA